MRSGVALDGILVVEYSVLGLGILHGGMLEINHPLRPMFEECGFELQISFCFESPVNVPKAGWT